MCLEMGGVMDTFFNNNFLLNYNVENYASIHLTIFIILACNYILLPPKSPLHCKIVKLCVKTLQVLSEEGFYVKK